VMCTPQTIQLNALGTATLTAEQVGAGSSDNCGIRDMTLDRTSFTEDDLGEQQVTLTVYDTSGNEATCEVTITVEPYEEPPGGVICPEAATIPLDEDGEVKSLHVVYNGSAELEFELNRSYFTCADIGVQEVTVSWTGDYTGSCLTEVTIVDNLPPSIVCVGTMDLRLNAAGKAGLGAEDVLQTEYDNCEVASMSLDRTEFTTADLGQQQVRLRVSDNSGNDSFCQVTVNVLPFEEEETPVQCAETVVVELDENGEGVINPRELYSGGTGSIQFTLSKENFTCEDLGRQIITFSYTTPAGSGSCDIEVEVKDPLDACVDVPPVIPPENDIFLMLYPNPSYGKVKVLTSAEILLERAEVFDMRGRFLFARDFTEPENKRTYDLDLSELQSGVYNIKFLSADNEYLRRAIISNH
ncbi:MAG: T9SS type A sorting domain-containing protein, partial [Salinimicrobium sp.]